MQTDPVLEAYDQWHRKMQTSDAEHDPLSFPWYQSIAPSVLADAGLNVLEVGCGRGEFAIWLSKRAPHLKIVGLDFSQDAIRIARESARAQGAAVSFVEGDAQALPFEDASFDLVLSCECMEHVPHPPKMARELARVARPGARLCLTTENYLNGMLLSWVRTWLSGKPFDSGSGVQPRENFFLFWMVRGYLQKAGWKIERMESCHYQWLLLPRVDPAKMRTDYFSGALARRLALPFGRHFAYFGRKPLQKG